MEITVDNKNSMDQYLDEKARAYAKMKPAEREERIKRQMEDYRSGDPKKVKAAKDAIVEDHHKFIYQMIHMFPDDIVKKYKDDLFNCGVIGILNSLDRFDPDAGKPTTFFKRYIQKELSDFVKNYVYGTTSYHATNMKKVKKALMYFEDRGIDDPSVADIALQTNLNPAIVENTMMMITVSNLKYYQEDEMYEIDEFMPSNRETPEKMFIESEEKSMVMDALKILDPIELKVVMMKFGLEDRASTDAEIAREIGRSISEMKSIRNRALSKLRKSTVLRELWGGDKEVYEKVNPLLEKYTVSFVTSNEDESDLFEVLDKEAEELELDIKK